MFLKDRIMMERVLVSGGPWGGVRRWGGAPRWGAAPPQELLERMKDYGQEGAFALWDQL